MLSINPKEMTIDEIKKMLETHKLEEVSSELVLFLQKDSRVGVQKLLDAYNRKKRTLVLKHKRLEEMSLFDRSYLTNSEKIVGIDEAGRGPLAGPVVAAAVVLDYQNLDWAVGVDDSKRLSRNERKDFSTLIKKNAIAFGIGVVEPSIIDKINILNATYLAMKKAVQQVADENDILLIDGNRVPEFGNNQRSVIKGDSLSLSIAAASIIAKETRDTLMEKWDSIYPEYGFIHHKGYGTQEHLNVLKERGLTPIHRKSFLRNLEVKQGVLF